MQGPASAEFKRGPCLDPSGLCTCLLLALACVFPGLNKLTLPFMWPQAAPAFARSVQQACGPPRSPRPGACTLVPAQYAQERRGDSIRLTYGGVCLNAGLVDATNASAHAPFHMCWGADAGSSSAPQSGAEGSVDDGHGLGSAAWAVLGIGAQAHAATPAFVYDSGISSAAAAAYTDAEVKEAAKAYAEVLLGQDSALLGSGAGAFTGTPVTLQDFVDGDPRVMSNLQRRGGYKSVEETVKMWEKLPLGVRVQGKDAVRKYLAEVDASHIISAQ